METDVTLQISKFNYSVQILAPSSTRIFYMLSFYLIIILFMIGPFKLKFTLTRNLSYICLRKILNTKEISQPLFVEFTTMQSSLYLHVFCN